MRFKESSNTRVSYPVLTNIFFEFHIVWQLKLLSTIVLDEYIERYRSQFYTSSYNIFNNAYSVLICS